MSININNPFSNPIASPSEDVKIMSVDYENNPIEKHAAVVEFLKDLRANEKVMAYQTP
jgi:hypothetical protein